MIAPVPAPLRFAHDGLAARTNCSDPDFAQYLTGKRNSKPRKVISFIPFGYDIDMLRLELMEQRDAVDLFVLFETSRTQRHTFVKPLFGAMILDSLRNITDKILLLNGDDALGPYLRIMEEKPNSWGLESAMRDIPLSIVPAFLRKIIGEDNFRDALALLHDADEMLRAEPLMMLKLCELKPDVALPIGKHQLSFKMSPSFLEDGTGSGSGGENLMDYMLTINGVQELVPTLERRQHRGTIGSEFPLGSFVHFSSPLQPISANYKHRGGIIEADLNVGLPPQLIEAGRNKTITADTIARHFMLTSCHAVMRWQQASPSFAQLVYSVLPKTLKENRQHFCWMWGRDGTSDFMARMEKDIVAIRSASCNGAHNVK
jgi:hypothetical protein